MLTDEELDSGNELVVDSADEELGKTESEDTLVDNKILDENEAEDEDVLTDE